MGRSTLAQSCKNVASLRGVNPSLYLPEELLDEERDPKSVIIWLGEELLSRADEPDVRKSAMEANPRLWFVMDVAYELGKFYTIFLRKGDREVHLMNVSPYAAGGDKDYRVFGERAEDVQDFLRDLRIPDRKIEPDEILMQTL